MWKDRHRISIYVCVWLVLQNRAFFTNLPTKINKILFPEKFAASKVAPVRKEAEEGHCHA